MDEHGSDDAPSKQGSDEPAALGVRPLTQRAHGQRTTRPKTSWSAMLIARSRLQPLRMNRATSRSTANLWPCTSMLDLMIDVRMMISLSCVVALPTTQTIRIFSASARAGSTSNSFIPDRPPEGGINTEAGVVVVPFSSVTHLDFSTPPYYTHRYFII